MFKVANDMVPDNLVRICFSWCMRYVEKPRGGLVIFISQRVSLHLAGDSGHSGEPNSGTVFVKAEKRAQPAQIQKAVFTTAPLLAVRLVYSPFKTQDWLFRKLVYFIIYYF